MIVRDIMNINVTRILIGSSLRQAAEVSALSSASDLAVVDEGNNFVGTLSEGDLMRAALPSLSDALSGGGSLATGYDLIEEKAQEIAGNPIDPIIIRDPITLVAERPGPQGCGIDVGQADPASAGGRRRQAGRHRCPRGHLPRRVPLIAARRRAVLDTARAGA